MNRLFLIALVALCACRHEPAQRPPIPGPLRMASSIHQNIQKRIAAQRLVTMPLTITALTIYPTNQLGYGPTDRFGGWSTNNSYSAQLTYHAPTSGVYTVEMNYSLVPNHCDSNTCYGMTWSELNTYSGNWSGEPGVHGFHTNDTAGDYTIWIPVPPWDTLFLRMRRVE